MKNKILFSAMLFVACMLSMNVNAQLEVETSGNVIASKKIAINGADFSKDAAANVYVSGLVNGASQYGIYSHFRMRSPHVCSTGCGISILGHIHPATFMSSVTEDQGQSRPLSCPFYAGVAGVTYYGIGVYGSNSLTFPTSWSEGNYAGYFNGDVKVTGLLYGQIVNNYGDNRLHENVIPLRNRNSLDIISQLNPVVFTLRQDTALINSGKEYHAHYGLVAQELQEIAPELVHEDGAGYLSINYTEMIPLLIQEIQRLSTEVEELQKEKEVQSAPYREQLQHQRDTQAILYQNTPNPFSDDTEIKYELPFFTQTASMYIYNMNGLQMAEYPISAFGEGNIVVSGRSLEAGMYLYSLIADGKVIDTKRMILTK